MGSYIADNRRALEEKHYVRKASTDTYWFDFNLQKLAEYQRRYGNAFCLVIYGSDDVDDAYVMPFSTVKAVFRPENVDHRGRWIGTIRRSVIRVTSGGQAMSVSGCYNAYDLLDAPAEEELAEGPLPAAVFQGDELDPLTLATLVDAFNRRFQNAQPQRRRNVSEQIARPGAIADYLKALHNYQCQVCGTAGFAQRNGHQYAEAHHLLELHKLIPGSYCSDNIIVVCPVCHRKLHFASVQCDVTDSARVVLTINGVAFPVRRNVLSALKPSSAG